MIGGTPPVRLSSRNERQNFFCKGDDNTAGNGKETVGSLRRVVAFERETDLHDTESEQDQTDGTNQAEDKVGQIVDYRQRVIACGKRRHRHGNHQRHSHHDGTVGNKALLNFALNGEGGG